MKKRIIKIACFLAAFVILFLLVQGVLHYRWSGDEALYTKNLDYSYHPKDTIDVICFGTSELYAGYVPMVTYIREGITGYNFAISYKSAITAYYQLMYALKYQTPKIVVCDFYSLFDPQLPSEVEPLYRKVVDCMPDASIKDALIRTICEVDSSQSYLSWKFPLLRYHSMWNELSELNFTKDYVYDESYPPYAKGEQLIQYNEYDGEPFDIVPELWDYDYPVVELSEISVKYYDMMIEECHKRGIEVVALMMPKLNSTKEIASKWDAMKAYFDSRGVYYLNYNTYDQVIRLDVTPAEDYYNIAHLNTQGAIKFSTVFAQDLKELFDLEDHRGDANYAEFWDEPAELYKQIYGIQ